HFLTLSLHDALPIFSRPELSRLELAAADLQNHVVDLALSCAYLFRLGFDALIDVGFCCASLLCDNFLWPKRLHLLNRSLGFRNRDRKSTRLNSSHLG